MAIEVAMEDDVFFADLNRQISLLIDDNDDDDNNNIKNPVAHFPSRLPPQIIFTQSSIHPSWLAMASSQTQNMYQEREVNSKGTGVFIPQWPQLRRKYKEHRRRPRSTNNKHLINSTSN